ncbi:MAG: hypothetical protein LC687_03960, partial [Actinobacteria bacterium]|nr:hypothetical protein [Actinomycetota bacterium]
MARGPRLRAILIGLGFLPFGIVTSCLAGLTDKNWTICEIFCDLFTITVMSVNCIAVPSLTAWV